MDFEQGDTKRRSFTNANPSPNKTFGFIAILRETMPPDLAFRILVVPDKIAGPGTERGLGAHRGAASPAQTGTGGQGPPVVWPRVMFPRVSRPPNHKNRPTGLRPAVPGGTVRKSGPPHGPRMAKGRVRRPASEARAGLPVSRARRVSRTRRSSTQTRVAKPCRL